MIQVGTLKNIKLMWESYSLFLSSWLWFNFSLLDIYSKCENCLNQRWMRFQCGEICLSDSSKILCMCCLNCEIINLVYFWKEPAINNIIMIFCQSESIFCCEISGNVGLICSYLTDKRLLTVKLKYNASQLWLSWVKNLQTFISTVDT